MWFKREFEWREDEEFGTEGWIMKHMPHFNAVDSIAFAHDVLEHFDYGDELKHEMMAFGSMLYMRAEGGWWSSYSRTFHPPTHNMAHDVSRFLFENNLRIQDCRTTKLDDMECEVEELSRETYRLLLSEAAYELSKGLFTREEMRNAVRLSMHWVRRGYRKCARRWHGASPFQLSDLFQELAQEFENHQYGAFNDKLTVSVNTRTLEFRIKHHKWRDPYAY